MQLLRFLFIVFAFSFLIHCQKCISSNSCPNYIRDYVERLNNFKSPYFYGLDQKKACETIKDFKVPNCSIEWKN